MPTAIESHDITPRRENEILLAPEEREQISRLVIDAIHAGVRLYFNDETSPQFSLRQRLEQANGKAAAFILEKIATGTIPVHNYSSENPDLFNYIRLLSLCASVDNTERLGALLESDDISQDLDRSNKSRILDILTRHGTAHTAMHIATFISKVLKTQYDRSPSQTRYLHIVDTRAALRALEAIQARTRDEDERMRVKNAVRLVSVYFNEAGYPLEQLDEHQSASAQDFGSYEIEDPHGTRENFRFDDFAAGDARIAADYTSHQYASTEARLETVKRLRHELKKEKGIQEPAEDDETWLLRRHWLEYREEHPSPYLPTLGIEIEVPYRAVMPQVKNPETRSDQWAQIAEKHRPYQKTAQLGIPSSPDKFWEFSHRPVHYHLTLSREVQALVEMMLLDKKYRRYPLHVTLGGITKTAGDEYILARALEASGWSTTGGRLLRPYLANLSSWTARGEGGVAERLKKSNDLEEDDYAVEMRAFQFQSLMGLDRLLRSAQLLGAALRAYQAESVKTSLKEGETRESRQALATIWKNFSEKCLGVFEAFALKRPDILWSTPGRNDEKRDSDFVPLANLLNEAQKNPDSRGAEFVHKIRKLIIEARSEINKIIYPEESSVEVPRGNKQAA